MKGIKIRVYGRVQGVFFRDTTRKVALQLGLTGFVRNEPDGSVYIKAEGPEDKLYELLEYAHRGPKYAKVERVDYEYQEAKNKFSDFEIES